MTHGSLCTGILGLDHAAAVVYGTELAWFSEVEPAACQIIEREHPGVPNLGDLTSVDWASVPRVDVLTAGYPCQPFSHAGKRKGKNDVRHLWPHIAEAVRVLRPRRLVLENVRGHLSLGFDEVLGSLAEAGFDAEWCVLRASDVGAPHQRARLFVVATDSEQHEPGHERRGGDFAHEQHRIEEPASPGRSDRPAADASGERHGGGQDAGAVGRVDSGDAGEARQRERARAVPVDRGATAVADAGGQRLDGRAGVEGDGWDEAEWGEASDHPGDSTASRGDAAPDAEGEQQPSRPHGDDPAPLGLATAGAGHRDQPGHPSEGVQELGRGAGVEWGAYAPAIHRWELVLGRPAPHPTDDAGRLGPAFVEWMMGYPAGWVDGLTRTQALKALGNAVVPQQGLAAISLLEAAHQCQERAA